MSKKKKKTSNAIIKLLKYYKLIILKIIHAKK